MVQAYNTMRKQYGLDFDLRDRDDAKRVTPFYAEKLAILDGIVVRANGRPVLLCGITIKHIPAKYNVWGYALGAAKKSDVETILAGWFRRAFMREVNKVQRNKAMIEKIVRATPVEHIEREFKMRQGGFGISLPPCWEEYRDNYYRIIKDHPTYKIISQSELIAKLQSKSFHRSLQTR